MKERRASLDKYLMKFTETLGYGIGDLVSYAPTGYRVMGIVTDIDPKIQKIYVDWAGCGNIHQHDPDELQITQLQEKKVRDRMANQKIKRIANKIIGDVATTEFLNEETADLLNKQFAAELSNSAFYHVCASWFENNGFPGFRAYFNKQGNDEAGHAMKVYQFLVDAGIQVVFPVIHDIPIPLDLKSIVRMALIKETQTTKNWQIITESAKKGYNVAAIELCQWFMNEQMEEESSLTILLQKVLNAPLNGSLEVIDQALKAEFSSSKTASVKTKNCRRNSSCSICV